MKFKKIFKNSLLLINYIVVIGLLFAYTAYYISPAKIWVIAFFGLAYPFLLFINLFFIILWLFRFKRYLFISLFAVLFGWGHLTKFIQIPFPAKEQTTPTEGFKVMSYNVRLFDLYNWSKNKKTRDNILKVIARESPDIICFQEFFNSEEKGYFTTLDTLTKIKHLTNYHTEYTYTVKNLHHFGIATLTTFPIVNRGKLDFTESSYNTCIYTDIKVKDDTLRIYNAHLSSLHFGKKEYQLFEMLGQDTIAQPLKKGIFTIGRQLRNAFVKRAPQAELIAEHIAHSPYPVILCGDFNDSPSSYAYHTITQTLNDAFVISGKGIGNTYLGKFPSFRIDYILHSPSLPSYQFTTLNDKLSDHYAISCYIEYGK